MAKLVLLHNQSSNSEIKSRFYINLDQICTVTWSKIGDLETIKITTSHSEVDPIILNTETEEARKILAWIDENRL